MSSIVNYIRGAAMYALYPVGSLCSLPLHLYSMFNELNMFWVFSLLGVGVSLVFPVFNMHS